MTDFLYIALQSGKVYSLKDDGELENFSYDQAGFKLKTRNVIVCHVPYTARKLGLKTWQPLDVLELFAFVHPGRFCVPTVGGLARALDLDVPDDPEDLPLTLMECVKTLMHNLTRENPETLLPMVQAMGLNGRGWPWTPPVFEAFGKSYDENTPLENGKVFHVWKELKEWSEEASLPPPAHYPVTGEESREQLAELLKKRHFRQEPRPGQVEYATQTTAAFNPAEEEEAPHVVLAEAGTGVGKTLGYLAPASVWAQKNKGAVWISTFTKNLQRQIENELEALYPEKEMQETYVSVRKGRENYLCLLNYEEMANASPLMINPKNVVAAGILARWVKATKDGDMSGRQFPGWLAGILGNGLTYGLTDRRGECIYSACDHYHKCFVEKAQRQSKRARLVVANHAVVMTQAALAGPDDTLPARCIFDEAHHLFDAADSAFASELTGREAADLRKWLLGPSGDGGTGQSKSRMKGLRRRVEDLINDIPHGQSLLLQCIKAAEILPSEGWLQRITGNAPRGSVETFLNAVYAQIRSRAGDVRSPYSIETGLFPLTENLAAQVPVLKRDLHSIQAPLSRLEQALRRKLDQDEGELNNDARKRLQGISGMLERRVRTSLLPWIGILQSMADNAGPDESVDWMQLEKIEGKVVDIGVYRHYKDPMIPFSQVMKPHVQGVLATSATLREEGGGGEHESWRMARERTGVHYLNPDVLTFASNSPFDYASNTKVIIVNDIDKNRLAQVAGAYKALFRASGGGALGLFTAINRLKFVFDDIYRDLDSEGISLFAQHLDSLDSGTLVDMFRADENACLFGTDAMRDGIDVPGRSLRMIVFDRVPWPRPTILHKARREIYGGRRYDDMLTRLKLKQAYGRLIRKTDDKGVFIMLDSAMPSRLHDAFPKGVEIERLGLQDTLNVTRSFFDAMSGNGNETAVKETIQC